MKLKNKWDQLKKDWKHWKELKRRSTGLGWDLVKRTIDAPEKWWAEKLAVVPAAKKFKFTGIEPALKEKLDGMFTGVVTGTHFFTPNEQGVANLAKDIETEHIGDSGEGPIQIHSDIQSTDGTKRPRPTKN
ncbi:L10-interacting MYB domain-containing protein-like [Phalaenopsis equestris]|uniref:L10-interacting MYB domain-containing protein-like n=1 Tax=Phalaenopsis equestris TaxID=78828 RepID=UPI0009E250A8|nr:L10-interacting MYB domain-containing protein-like [Phalaenopsis equestris]